MWDTYKKYLYRGCKETASGGTLMNEQGEFTEDEDAMDTPVEDINNPSKLLLWTVNLLWLWYCVRTCYSFTNMWYTTTNRC